MKILTKNRRIARNLVLGAGITLASASIAQASMTQNPQAVTALSSIMGVDANTLSSDQMIEQEVQSFLSEDSRSHPLKDSLRKFWKKLKENVSPEIVAEGLANRFEAFTNRSITAPAPGMVDQIEAAASEFSYVRDSFLAFEQRILEGEFKLHTVKKVFEIAEETSRSVGYNILGEEAMYQCASEYQKKSIVDLFRLIVATKGSNSASFSKERNAANAIAAMERQATLVFEISPEQAHKKVCNQLNADIAETGCPRHLNFKAEACK